MSESGLSYAELHEAWPALSAGERVEGFSLLSRAAAEELFDTLDARDQLELILNMPSSERRLWLRLLAPDDAADVIQAADEEQRGPLLELLDEPTRKEVSALLAYAEDAAGGLMNPRFARLRPDMTVDAAISYLRRQRAEQVETIYYAYVLDNQQHLLGVVSLRDLVTAPSDRLVRDVMRTATVTVREQTDQEVVSHLFAEHDLVAVPVVDEEGRMKGIVTVDDIVDVVREEATEDMQKIGGTAALDAPYLQVNLAEMLKKRVGWLAALLVGESLAVTAMERYQGAIAQAAVLASFMPLIISSGGNSGSQAATLVVRAMALGEVRLRDWFRVIRREVATGLGLGSMLGVIAFGLTLVWQLFFTRVLHQPGFGEHYLFVGVCVACSILAVALWGTFAGSMLPFVMRAAGFDPASASAPLIATLVDVTGVVIYFSIAGIILRGTLL